MDVKKLDTGSRDAISWLPDEVLGKILSFLPTKQAASTSVLSKKWRTVFRLVDILDFDDSGEGEQESSYVFPESFENLVYRTLDLQCGYPIRKFSLKCHVGKDDKRQKTCVRRWEHSVLTRGVLEMDLRIHDRGIHFMHPLLFANETLVKLSIGTKLYLGELSSIVFLPSLKFLFIDTVLFFGYEELCCVLLAGCPVLEELLVHHHDFSATPDTISSTSVKRLSVHYDSPDDVDGFSFMSFDLPNLVYLDYSHCALRQYIQVNLESLVEAKLDLYLEERAGSPDVTDLIIGISNVETLHLSRDSVDVLSQCVVHGLLLPVFNNLVKLSFGSKKNEQGWKLLPKLLKQSPKLKTLIIQGLDGYIGDMTMSPYQVKVLHVLGYRGTAEEFKQLKSFLGEFECLELVQVDVTEEDDGIIMQATNDLMTLPGSSVSSKCHVKVNTFSRV